MKISYFSNIIRIFFLAAFTTIAHANIYKDLFSQVEGEDNISFDRETMTNLGSDNKDLLKRIFVEGYWHNEFWSSKGKDYPEPIA